MSWLSETSRAAKLGVAATLMGGREPLKLLLARVMFTSAGSWKRLLGRVSANRLLARDRVRRLVSDARLSVLTLCVRLFESSERAWSEVSGPSEGRMVLLRRRAVRLRAVMAPATHETPGQRHMRMLVSHQVTGMVLLRIWSSTSRPAQLGAARLPGHCSGANVAVKFSNGGWTVVVVVVTVVVVVVVAVVAVVVTVEVVGVVAKVVEADVVLAVAVLAVAVLAVVVLVLTVDVVN